MILPRRDTASRCGGHSPGEAEERRHGAPKGRFFCAFRSEKTNPFLLFPPFSYPLMKAAGHVPSVSREAFEMANPGLEAVHPVGALCSARGKHSHAAGQER